MKFLLRAESPKKKFLVSAMVNEIFIKYEIL